MNNYRIQILLQIIFDFFAISISFILQYWFRFHSGVIPVSIAPDFETTIVTYILFLMFWYLTLFLSGLYRNWYEQSPFDELKSVFKAVLIGTLIIIFFVYTDSKSSPRMMFLMYFFVFFFALSLGRFFQRQVQKKLRAKKIIQIPMLLIGDYYHCLDFYEKTLIARNWGFSVSGILVPNQIIPDNHIQTIPIHLGLQELDSAIKLDKPEVIVLLSSKSDHDELLEIASKAADYDLRVKIQPDLYEIFTGQTRARTLWGMPLIEISTQLLKPYQAFLKRTFDIFFSLIVIILGLPFWFLVAIIIKLSSPGPIFYVQERVGKDGKHFNIFKFRSMRVAETIQKPNWTQKNDPRVFQFGKFIRKTHIDEIPQFWNALIGDMSVVGPRPEVPKFVEEFSKAMPQYKRRLKVRPGLTGWWQIQYVSYEFSLDEIKNRLKDDFYYIENFSLILDLEIIIRTIWLMIKGHGQT
jgi:exopolysaccharide biosynthesis polyprenyl glycosylphosphotransferase